jgi:hypothetical protein
MSQIIKPTRYSTTSVLPTHSDAFMEGLLAEIYILTVKSMKLRLQEELRKQGRVHCTNYNWRLHFMKMSNGEYYAHLLVTCVTLTEEEMQEIKRYPE